jgi:L-seryl-tRNA(Ser) seleniumtransferase
MVSCPTFTPQPVMGPFRVIPSIDQLLQRTALREAVTRHGHESVSDAARQAAAELRARVATGSAAPADAEAAFAWLEARALALAGGRTRASLRRVINATGIIVHTNLGRAPLSDRAFDNARLALGYSNLEYDLERGARGHRHVHAERLLTDLTGAEAAIVVNNTAAAALLTLAALAAGREVIVSRGELVEIGGGFRVPDVLAQSGAQLREVGTTNRTRAADYAAAIGDRTALMLRVHPSNFRIEGFTERPSLEELTSLARTFKVPLVEDLGSGWIGDAEAGDALATEPEIGTSLRGGADLVMFSGDKLLGGPQAGIICGRRDLVDRLRTHPLMRALRVDKVTYALLEATLALWAERPARPQIPLYRMLTMAVGEIDRRSRALADRLSKVRGLRAVVIDGESAPGGGSAPGETLPTRLVTVTLDGMSASALLDRLRALDPPVIGRIVSDTVVLDLRTVLPDDEEPLARALETLGAD